MARIRRPPQTNRVQTGIPGLDHILYGGLPRRRLYLIEGEPGTGKTTLALQFLLAGIARGEKSLYITLSETREEIEEVAQSHGWNLSKLEIVELSALDEKIAMEAQSTLFHPSEVELTETTKFLLEAVERANPQRVVLDSLSELRLLAQTALRYRREILALKQYFAGRDCTTLLLDDASGNTRDAHVQSLAHGAIRLEQTRPSYGAERRRLTVLKVRGSMFRGGLHDFAIYTGGLQAFPRLVAAEHRRQFKAENISSGVKGLDALLGGGLARGSSNLFTGPPGTGKSTLALKYAMAAAERGEKVLMFTFDESLNVLYARARGLNLQLDKFVKGGIVRLRQIDPAELSPGELAFSVLKAVQEEDVRLVYLDSLNGYLHAMGDERSLNLQLHELLTFLNQQGVVTILVLSPQGFLGQMQAPIDLTYLADTVLALRFFENEGRVCKAIAAIKKRTGKHETSIRELKIDRSGVTVGPALDKLRGVLTGVPVQADAYVAVTGTKAAGK
ncbi:MAG TPA: ATPase domain-containing protein [Chthoniobacterales bacterium]|jgi:circadian clock protein KaiC|nr:ATPase domain-containing protein [Chthoniobacterales bacterium]